MRSLLVLAGLAALLTNISAGAAENAAAPINSAEPAIANASENTAPVIAEEGNSVTELPASEELDINIVPEEDIYIEPESKLILPQCDDKHLLSLVLAKISEYHQQHQASNLLEKRRQALLLKNLQKFSELSAEGFTSKENFNVANSLLMTKINNGLDDSQIRLCRNEGGGKAAEIYLLVYPYYGQIRVNILNYLANQTSEDEFFVSYPQ